MSFESLTSDHAPARRDLRTAWTAGRLPHALLLSGEAGIGKQALAEWLVCLRWCHADDAPCGSCPSCKKVLTGNHPDLEVVRRNPSADADPKGLGSRLEITVAQIREGVLPALGLSAVEGGGRSVIISAAEDLNEQAQNALLKTLEEPPEGTLLVLVTSREEGLLDTIRSRCQEFRLAPLDAREMAARAPGCDPVLLALARGRPGRLPALEALDVRALILSFDELLAGTGRGMAFGAGLGALVDAAMDRIENADEPMLRRLVLEVLHARIRDLTLLEGGHGEGALLTGAPLEGYELPSIQELRTLETAVLEASTDIRRHLPPAVAWAALGNEFAMALVGGGGSPKRYT
jgi:DNA polymerase III delta' subunit